MCKRFIIVAVLFCLLCAVGIASAQDAVYTQSKDGIIFDKTIDTTKINIDKTNNEIKMSSGQHIETSVMISEGDVENVLGNHELLHISHFTDSGENDWNRIVIPKYENGYLEVGVEFSTVTITPYISTVKNWGFETWSGGDVIPTDWTQIGSVVGGGKSTVSDTGSYSYGITGNGVSANRGAIQQTTTLSAGYYTIGASIYATGITAGYISVDLAWVGSDSGGIVVSGDNDGFVWITKREYIPSANPTIRIATFNTVNTGGAFYVDNVILSPDPSGVSATEIDYGTNATQSFSYTPTGVFSDSILVTEFMDCDITAHGKTSVTSTIDGTPTTAYIVDGDQIFIDTSGLSVAAHDVVVIVNYNLPPTMISPANGTTITRDFPPLYANQVFVWEDTGTTCQIQVAEDSAFSNLVYSSETTSATATASLAAGTYYWRVRSYDPVNLVYGDWPSDYSFVIVSSTGSVSGTGIAGCVYESFGLGDYRVVSGALVTVYNTTYSMTKTTGAEGYYQVTGLTAGTYYVSVENTGYEDTGAIPVTVVTDEVAIQNVAIQAAQSYFAPHYVKFKIIQTALWAGIVPYDVVVEGATVSVYSNGDTSAYATQTTGSDGACGFSLSENIRYRIVVTYGTITQTEYITPVESSYEINIEGDPGTGLLPESQFYDVCNITIDKTQMNSSVAKIDITYTDNENATNSTYFEIGQMLDNGTFVAIDTSAVFTGNATCSLYVDNYKGESYTVIAHVVHDSFGAITKYFVVTFSGSNLPFTGKAMGYLGVIILFVIAAMWGKNDVTHGALLTVGMGWFMWYLDIFECFGSTQNTLMGAGLLLATLLAIMHIINKKRDEGMI